jgi:hypothetical protein
MLFDSNKDDAELKITGIYHVHIPTYLHELHACLQAYILIHTLCIHTVRPCIYIYLASHLASLLCLLDFGLAKISQGEDLLQATEAVRGMYIYVYVYIYIYIYMCVCVCLHIIYIYIYIYICVCVCVCVCLCMYVYICIYVCMFACIYGWMDGCIT